MAERIGSALAEEIASQIVSGLIEKRGCESDEENIERLEMAHIKLEAVLDTSDKWQINDASLLRWRKKLKRATEECEETLHQYKQRVAEDEEEQQKVRNSSFPRRLAHATKSFVFSFLERDNKNISSSSAVRRFEWFADGAGEFLRFVELGGTPRQYMFFDPLIGHLLAGKELRYRIVRGSQYNLFWVRPPISFEERGLEAKLVFVYEDNKAPDKNLYLALTLQLSESMDIVGITIKCLELVTPHFKSAAEAVRRQLTQLPTQDFTWVPYVDSSDNEHWNSLHSTATQWFLPNPHCCKQHEPKSCSSKASTLKLSNFSLEPVIYVSLQCHIPLSKYNMQRSTIVQGETSCLKELPHLKLGLGISPHGSSEDLMPAVESSAIEVIDGEEQSSMHTNISLEQLDEVTLPKAIDCLYQKAEATAYQMLWKSKHGTAYLEVEKTGLMKMPPKQIREAGNMRSVIQRRHYQTQERWIQMSADFLDLWIAHAPDRLKGSIVEWLQKEDEMQLVRQSAP